VDKLIKAFAAAIDQQKTKVKHGPQRITLLGGEKVNAQGQATSQRGIFLLTPGDLADSLVVPEDFKNWNHFGVYDNLLAFEEDVCALVDTIVVFLESAGAIAEFGAFIKNKDIAPKLFIVVNGTYDEDSFIQLGLIRYLTKNFPETKVITSQNEKLEKQEIAFLVEHMHERYAKQSKTSALARGKARHQMFLIVDFIDLMQVARISDIHLFLTEMKVLINKPRLEQLILALKSVRLIEESRILSERCFSLTNPTPLIEYAFISGTTAKRVSWKAMAFEKTFSDKWRKYAYEKLKLPPTVEGQSNVA
jgi:hypothetical protein